MLGNGLRVVVGAVAASEGELAVETRGHYLTLAVDAAYGTTVISKDQPVPFEPGLHVHITLGPLLPNMMARTMTIGTRSHRDRHPRQ